MMVIFNFGKYLNTMMHNFLLLPGRVTVDEVFFFFFYFIYLSQTQKRPYMHTHAKKKKKKKYQP